MSRLEQLIEKGLSEAPRVPSQPSKRGRNNNGGRKRTFVRTTTMLILLTLICTSVAYAYPAVSGYLNAMGAPKTKGELRAYYPELKAHDDELRLGDSKPWRESTLWGEAQDHQWFVDKVNQDIKILDGVIKLATNCIPCVVMQPAPNPAPNNFETLEPIVIPDIQGGNDEELSDEDRRLLDENERKHDLNQEKHFRNEAKRKTYLSYLESLILYYTNPEIKCPEVITEVVFVPQEVEIVCDICPPPVTPECPTCPPPFVPPPNQKLDGNVPAPDPNGPGNEAIPNPPQTTPGTGGPSQGQGTTGTATGDNDFAQGQNGPPIEGTPNQRSH